MERFDLRREATPRPLLERPVHRWFVFPHSYGPGLVEAVLDRRGFGQDAKILDPFVGSGTTLLTARERSMDAAGMDLSPLATLASRVKVRTYDEKSLRRRFRCLTAQSNGGGAVPAAPRLLRMLRRRQEVRNYAFSGTAPGKSGPCGAVHKLSPNRFGGRPWLRPTH